MISGRDRTVAGSPQENGQDVRLLSLLLGTREQSGVKPKDGLGPTFCGCHVCCLWKCGLTVESKWADRVRRSRPHSKVTSRRLWIRRKRGVVQPCRRAFSGERLCVYRWPRRWEPSALGVCRGSRHCRLAELIRHRDDCDDHSHRAERDLVRMVSDIAHPCWERGSAWRSHVRGGQKARDRTRGEGFRIMRSRDSWSTTSRVPAIPAPPIHHFAPAS